MLITERFKKLAAYGLLASFAWFPFYIPWSYCKGSGVDVSFLLDAPAGKHGFLGVRDDGHFYFEDGTRAKFWGVNIHADKGCFPSYAQAEDSAKRLAQLGCNIVRMHFLDNVEPGGVISAGYGDTQHFSESQMEKMDYFIYQLKKNGIYICFDVLGLGARRFKPGDGVADYDKIRFGAGGASFFDKRIIELSRKFAADFLSHVNPYTGKSYLDEPAIAMVEMTNENTLFSDWVISTVTPYYKKELGGSFDDRKFLFKLQDNYQREMYDYLRSIGVKVPIGSSNLPLDSLNLMADANMDFTDMHVYWDLCDKLDRIHNRPLIMQDHRNPATIINTISIAKVCGKPLISTEWGSNWPNDWRAADVLTTAAYAALNDWDALFLYSYVGGYGISWDGLEKKLYYGTVVFNDPAKMGVFPLASLIFLRGDAQKASNVHRVSYSNKQLFDMKGPHKDRLRLAGAAYVSRLEKCFYEAGDEGPEPQKGIDYPGIGLSMRGEIAVSDTGEIIRDRKKGIFILKTPRTFSFSGFVGREKGQEYGGVEIVPESNDPEGSDFATFTITSLDGKDISRSKHLLLAAVGRVRNSGQKLAPHTTKNPYDVQRDVYILDAGKGPILAEAIGARVSIKKGKKRGGIEVFSLDEEGLRKSKLPVSTGGDSYSFRISGKDNTIYYDITRE